MHFIQKNSYVLLVFALSILFTVAGTKKMSTEINYESITVTEGDTLWEYSLRYAENIPTDRWIEDIMKLNNLSSTTIQVGEELRIPKKDGTSHQDQDIATHMAGEEK